MYLKKACRLGHLEACDEGIALARSVKDTSNVSALEALRANAAPQLPPTVGTSPAKAPNGVIKRKVASP